MIYIESNSLSANKMSKQQLIDYLVDVNSKLKDLDIKGEITIYGGSVMVLAFDARASTMDVDAIFKPSSSITEVIMYVAHKNDLPAGWLNQAVRAYVSKKDHTVDVGKVKSLNKLANLSHLKVYIPVPEYLLAMKLMSMRIDTLDRFDARFLIKKLGYSSLNEALEVVSKYYPGKAVSDITKIFVKEVIDELNG